MIHSVATTVASRAEAQALARKMVEAKLAACAQIEGIESVYIWEGALQQEGEFRILFKTVEARYDALEAALKAAHPYSLPMILAVPAARVSVDCARWVEEMCGVSG